MMRRAPQAAAAARRAVAKTAPPKTDKKPVLDTFIANGDFTGAVALLEFERRAGEETPMTLPWLGYAAFHLGDYAKALKAYQVRYNAQCVLNCALGLRVLPCLCARRSWPPRIPTTST